MALSEKGYETGVESDVLSSSINAGLPRLYVNGFMNQLTPTDVVSVILTNGQPVAVLNYSFSTVKTWASALLELISNLETATKQPILYAGDVTTALQLQESTGETKDPTEASNEQQ